MVTRNVKHTPALGIKSALALGTWLAMGNVWAQVHEVAQYGGTYSSWPSTWRTLSSATEASNTGVSDYFDFVGDATNPGLYWSSDANYLYFRARVDVDEVANTTLWGGTVFVMIQYPTGGDTLPDWAFGWDVQSSTIADHGLEMEKYQPNSGNAWSDVRFDDIDGNNAQKLFPPGSADFRLTGGDGYVRTVDHQSTSNFGDTTYVDYAVSWSYLAANTALRSGQTWNVQMGTRVDSNDHNWVSTDVAAGANPGDPRTYGGTIVVPEPQHYAFAAGLGLASFALLRRRCQSVHSAE